MKHVLVKDNIDAGDQRPYQSDNYWTEAFRRFCGNKVAIAGFAVFAFICLACLFGPLLTNWEYNQPNISNRFASPTLAHPFGTDAIGRDMLTRILHGGRVSLRIAFVSTLIAAVVGSIIGAAMGYFRGAADVIISPVLDALNAIPIILLVLVIESVFGRGSGYFMYAMAAAAVPQFARLVRVCVMKINESAYIEAARALGMGHIAILRKHVLHNMASPLLVRITIGVAEALMICTLLGYFGIGIRPPTPEWGTMVQSGMEGFRRYPYLLIFPCVVITISVISVNLFGDGLRDAFDPSED